MIDTYGDEVRVRLAEAESKLAKLTAATSLLPDGEPRGLPPSATVGAVNKELFPNGPAAEVPGVPGARTAPPPQTSAPSSPFGLRLPWGHAASQGDRGIRGGLIVRLVEKAASRGEHRHSRETKPSGAEAIPAAPAGHKVGTADAAGAAGHVADPSVRGTTDLDGVSRDLGGVAPNVPSPKVPPPKGSLNWLRQLGKPLGNLGNLGPFDRLACMGERKPRDIAAATVDPDAQVRAQVAELEEQLEAHRRW